MDNQNKNIYIEMKTYNEMNNLLKALNNNYEKSIYNKPKHNKKNKFINYNIRTTMTGSFNF